MAKVKKFSVKQVRSLIGSTQDQRDTMRCLGLGRIGRQSVLTDNPANRGQIYKVQHLVQVSILK